MALYRAHLRDAGHAWQSHQAALMLPIHVAPTSAAAREAMRPGVEKFYQNMLSMLSYLPESYTGHRERVQNLRKMDLKKNPSVSETLDWARALVTLNANTLDRETLENTLTVLLKYEADVARAKRILRGGGNPGASKQQPREW